MYTQHYMCDMPQSSCATVCSTVILCSTKEIHIGLKQLRLSKLHNFLDELTLYTFFTTFEQALVNTTHYLAVN